MRILLALCLLLSSLVFADDPETAPEMTQSEMDKRACQVTAARAAWGALAGFAGAPAKFKYVPIAQVREMAMHVEETPLPTDAIYVGLWGDDVDNDLEARKNYELAAFEGWKQAQAWMKEGKPSPGPHVLMAIFNKHLCEH